MENLVIGILAHVDAGKTTLSEAILYETGYIREMGRVDKGNSFLDTYELERSRGITIFSKQAIFEMGDIHVTLLDTPGHVDFSAEMERTLQVLDYAILVIDGADEMQGHTQTLWRLLSRYEIPVFLFINKMDMPGADKKKQLHILKEKLNGSCVDFSESDKNIFYENIAMCEERALESFLETNEVGVVEITSLIKGRKLFPCFFGSALKLEGIKEFLIGMERYMICPKYPSEFGAKIYKITRDGQGSRLSFMKITGGELKVKDVIPQSQEKINQIRIYSGDKYEAVGMAQAGCICAVMGLENSHSGQGIGTEEAALMPVLEPVLTYQIRLPEDCDAALILPKLKQLEEEEPELHIIWEEELKEIQAQLMGDVQIDVIKSLVKERFGVTIEFGAGNIVYKETIASTVEGVGHFEPLRHYAEVHLLLEPGEQGSGLTYAAEVSEDELDRNWQRLILTHLEEKDHKGVLTGSSVTDIKITLVAGRAHKKHTEGGDFRQATYRAVRQGLKQAKSILLEPYYNFRIEVPQEMLGRAMTDIEKMGGTFHAPEQNVGQAILTGNVPVVEIRDYQKELTSYTKGKGRLLCTLKGYEPCHNAQEVIQRMDYDSERDMKNPTGSVFCAHGAGFIVDWNQVSDYMHLESNLVLQQDDEAVKAELELDALSYKRKEQSKERWLGTEEVDAILERTLYANRKDKNPITKNAKAYSVGSIESHVIGNTQQYGKDRRKEIKSKEEYLLVDGYNIIFAWEELNKLAEISIDGARGRLMDILCNYQAIMKMNLIVVFDAYRVQGHVTEVLDYHNIHVVYTKEAETADRYIEKFAHENGRKYNVTVATSDGLEQIITRGQGCMLLSARELQVEIERVADNLRLEYENRRVDRKNYMFDSLPEKSVRQIEELKK